MTLLQTLSVWAALLWSPARAGPLRSTDHQTVLGVLDWMEDGSEPRSRVSGLEPPEYMLELYRRFSAQRGPPPAPNTIRSFRNQDYGPRCGQTVPLLFNISVPRHERVIAAELRLYALLRGDAVEPHAARWKVTVFEVRHHAGLRELMSKRLLRKHSGWEDFDLTDAVRHWKRSEPLSLRLEVQVQHPDHNPNQFENTAGQLVDLDIERSPDGGHEPMLIVFSDDDGGGWKYQMIADEKQVPGYGLGLSSDLNRDSSPRVRRGAPTENCRKAELYVDFKDIGWDSWVVNPAGYQAYTCRGACNYPLTPEVSPTQHAIVQTLLNLKSPQKTSQACCVPTKLEPISLLYVNKNGVVVFKQRYEGMVVAECGCR